MSGFKRIDNWEDKLAKMTVEELEKEVAHWKQRAQFLQPKVRKLAMKRAHEVQRILDRKRSEE